MVQLERLALENAEAKKHLRVATAELARVGRQLADHEVAEIARIDRAERAERAAATIPAPPQFPPLPPAGHPRMSEPALCFPAGPGYEVVHGAEATGYEQLGFVDPLRAHRTRSMRETMREMDTIFAVAEARLHAKPPVAPPAAAPEAPAAPAAVSV